MYSVSVLRICLVLVAFTFFIECTYGQEDESTVKYCLLKTGGIGSCMSFHNCDLMLLAQEGQNPAQCDSDTDDVFVCCPMQIPVAATNNTIFNTTNSTNNTRNVETTKITRKANSALTKSSQKCLEYSKIKCSDTATTTIINGEEVSSVENYPHMALLGYGDAGKPHNLTWQCGGTLISEQYILTAAHCLVGSDKTRPVVAHLGFLNKKNRTQFGTLQEFKIVEIIKHPDRKDPIMYEDIALLKLEKPVVFTKAVFPACLHEDMELSVNRAQATGWGDTLSGTNVGSDNLRKVTLSILKHEDCFSNYPQFRRLSQGIKKDQQFCAGEDKKDTCQGDSGGPLQIIGADYCMHSIIGVTSFGNDCGIQPGVYTRVSHYVPWIEGIVWP